MKYCVWVWWLVLVLSLSLLVILLSELSSLSELSDSLFIWLSCLPSIYLALWLFLAPNKERISCIQRVQVI